MTDVKEGIKESVLTVNVRYKAYDVLEEKYLAALYLSVNSILGEEERALTLEELISMYEKMDKLLESKTTIIERTIKVYMNKEDGFWDTDNYNPELEATAMLCKYVIYCLLRDCIHGLSILRLNRLLSSAMNSWQLPEPIMRQRDAEALK